MLTPEQNCMPNNAILQKGFNIITIALLAWL